MKSFKMLILFEIGLILVYFDSLKQKLSPTNRIPVDMFFDEKYSKHLRFRRLKNLKELNEILK